MNLLLNKPQVHLLRYKGFKIIIWNPFLRLGSFRTGIGEVKLSMKENGSELICYTM